MLEPQGQSDPGRSAEAKHHWRQADSCWASAGWTVGDKTGAGGYGTRNDIAVLWPPQQEPIVLAVMTNHDEQDATYDDALIARAAEVVVDQLS